MTTTEIFSSLGAMITELRTEIGDKVNAISPESMVMLLVARELASLRELLASTITTDSSKNQAVRTTKVSR